MKQSARILALLTAAFALALSGCGALDELDAAAAMMDSSKDKKATAKDTKQASAESARKRPLEWDNVQSIHTQDLDSSFVRCRIDGRTQFMRADQCRASGGRAEDV